MVNYQKIFLIIGSLVSFVPPTQANMWNWSWSWLWGNQNKSTKEVIAKKQPDNRESFLTATAIHNASKKKQHTAYCPRSGPHTIAQKTLMQLFDVKGKEVKARSQQIQFQQKHIQKIEKEASTSLKNWKNLYSKCAKKENTGIEVLNKIDTAKSSLRPQLKRIFYQNLLNEKLNEKQKKQALTKATRDCVAPFHPNTEWHKTDCDLQNYLTTFVHNYIKKICPSTHRKHAIALGSLDSNHNYTKALSKVAQKAPYRFKKQLFETDAKNVNENLANIITSLHNKHYNELEDAKKLKEKKHCPTTGKTKRPSSPLTITT